MAREIKTNKGTHGATLYVVIERYSDGKYWNALTAAWESYASADWTSTKYCLAATEDVLGRFRLTFPAGITTDSRYDCAFYSQVGGSPSNSGDTYVDTATLDWSGTALETIDSLSLAAGAIGTVTAQIQFDQYGRVFSTPALPSNAPSLISRATATSIIQTFGGFIYQGQEYRDPASLPSAFV